MPAAYITMTGDVVLAQIAILNCKHQQQTETSVQKFFIQNSMQQTNTHQPLQQLLLPVFVQSAKFFGIASN